MAMTQKDSDIIKNLVQKDSFLVLGSRITKHPFIVWDKEGGEDQIYIFTSEEKFKEKEKEFRADKYAMFGINVEQKSMKKFFIDLYSYGVSQVVIVSDEEEYAIKMENIIPKPDFSKYPENQQPLLNPSLEISVLYFLQEFTRDMPIEEKKELIELEEEMAANIARAKYLLPVRLTEEPPKDWDGKLKEGTFDIPYLSNSEGEMYLPIFADVVEFSKFNVQNDMKATIVSIEQIQKMLVGKCLGTVLNPASMGFRLMTKTLDNILKKVKG
ncbi:MAG: SseB family protein [Lachnospiraceae bacterium]|nr:SseB family protein [Lachnospiraceae bacterium]